MKVAAYVVEDAGSWYLRISLALEVDLDWWKCNRMIILDPSIPLGWAVKLRERFVYHKGMQRWETRDWEQYVREILRKEWDEEVLQKECSIAGAWDSSISTGLGSTLEYNANLLHDLLSGRSLLEQELMALLDECHPVLMESWRCAAQLAHLQGRLILEAAVREEPLHARAAGVLGKGRQQRENAGGLMRARAVAASLPR